MSQRKLKSLKDSTVIVAFFEGDCVYVYVCVWGGKIIIHGFILDRDGSFQDKADKDLEDMLCYMALHCPLVEAGGMLAASAAVGSLFSNSRCF